MICRWCGDNHPIARLCQSAQRGITRRSFCFLFGAGLVATTIPLPSILEPTSIGVTADQFTTISQSINAPGIARFKTRNPAIQLGKSIIIEYSDVGILFSGIVSGISDSLDGSREVIAISNLSELNFKDFLKG